MDFIARLQEAGRKNHMEYLNCIPFWDAEGYSSVIVALLPYYAGEHTSYLAKYTRGLDYHTVGRTLLARAIEEAGAEIHYQILIDASPLNEIELAVKAGLGVRGKNNLLINKTYGSFVFILTALTDQPVPEFTAEEGACLECGLCMKNCPYGAIGKDGIDYEKCISHISQKRQIDEREAEMLKSTGFVWGCDLCQNCCPHNQNIPLTTVPEFKENLLMALEDLSGLSNREFKEKYRRYALAYKGKGILKRNIDLIHE